MRNLHLEICKILLENKRRQKEMGIFHIHHLNKLAQLKCLNQNTIFITNPTKNSNGIV